MRGQAGFFDVEERLKELSAKGDALERLTAVVDFDLFRADLERAVPRSDGSKGGRPAFDHVLMFKVLVLQASHSLSDERTEYLIRDRLSFMRFLGLGLADTVPDANTIWTFREALTRAKLRAEWAKKPAKLRQKDRDARWTVKYTKAKPSEDGAPRVDLAVPAFGYKNHIGIDRRHRLIRSWAATDASRHDGALLPALIDKDNTASDVWADTAYRSKANEKHLANNGLRSQIHRKKPRGKPMSRRTARANGRKSAVRAAVEHVFARQKGPMGLYIRTIGLARARTKIGLANLVYNMKRMVWLIAQAAPA
jgi:IS5 family transposase